MACKDWRVRGAGGFAGGRLRDRQSSAQGRRQGSVVARSGMDNVSSADVEKFLGASGSLGADSTDGAAGVVFRLGDYARLAVVRLGRNGGAIGLGQRGISGSISAIAVADGLDSGCLGSSRPSAAEKSLAGSAKRCNSLCGVAGGIYFEPGEVGRRGVCHRGRKDEGSQLPKPVSLNVRA